MTAQSSDVVKYKGQFYEIKEVDFLLETISFKEYGLRPNRGMSCTGCWNGYNFGYKIVNGELILNTLSIFDSEAINHPINGIIPKKEDYYAPKYDDLGIQTSSTGKMIIANDFDWHFYIHMGNQDIKGYNNIWELEFKNGKLINETNMSNVVKEYRHYRNGENPSYDLDLWWLKTQNRWDELHERQLRKKKEEEIEFNKWKENCTKEEWDEYLRNKEQQKKEWEEAVRELFNG